MLFQGDKVCMSILEKRFKRLVSSAVSNGVSDIHLRTGEKPFFRMSGDLVPVKTEVYTSLDLLEVASLITGRALLSFT